MPLLELTSSYREERDRRRRLREDAIPAPDEVNASRLHKSLVGNIPTIDWQEPNYGPIERHRVAALDRINNHPGALRALKVHYRYAPWDFINDWGYTTDTRNVEIGVAVKTPFILFPRQVEWLQFVMRKWQNQERGLTEKSRDCGVSWLAIGLGCTLCLHYEGINIGYGSRLRDYVDKRGFPKALFWKARKFMECLPREFSAGWDSSKDAPLMLMNFRQTGSTMSGEGGENIGRGDRASIYFVDEAAHLEQPEAVDAALSATTNCQIDISSVNGSNNPFAQKRHSGKVEVFIFDWRDDPRKDDDWYRKQENELNEVVLAQEVNRDYNASVAGILIPSAWVRAAIDAHVKLKVSPTGKRTGGMDVADEGKDLNAFAGGQGILVDFLDEWKGAGGDIYASVERVFRNCDAENIYEFKYDADGLGAGVRGDARKINEGRRKKGAGVLVLPFRGSGGVFRPDAEDEKGRKNKDFFKNAKAQSWWRLRTLFRNTYRAVNDGQPFDPDQIISLSSGMLLLQKLVTELSQPTFDTNNVGKIVIDKTPDGARSPNLADAVMIKVSKVSEPLHITPEIVARTAQPGPASGSMRMPTGMGGMTTRFRGSRVRT